MKQLFVKCVHFVYRAFLSLYSKWIRWVFFIALIRYSSIFTSIHVLYNCIDSMDNLRRHQQHGVLLY